ARGGEQYRRHDAGLQEIAGEWAQASDRGRQERDQREQHAGEPDIEKRPSDVAPPFGEGATCEGEGGRARDDAERGGDRVAPEADPGDPVRVVLQVEGKER